MNFYNGNVYVINLKHRTDRIEFVKNEFKKLQINPIIVEAIYNEECGTLGCSMSHLKCLQKAKDNNLNYCFISEDDVYFNVTRDEMDLYVKEFLELKNVPVMSFVSFVKEKKDLQNSDLFYVSDNMQTATFYCVKKWYFDKLIENFTESINSFDENSTIDKVPIDKNWKKLQKVDTWITPKKLVGGQIKSYSDIWKRQVNYFKYFKRNKMIK